MYPSKADHAEVKEGAAPWGIMYDIVLEDIVR